MIASTQITSTEIFAFIAVLVFKLLSRKVDDVSSDIKGLIDLRKRFPYNPLIGYININSRKEKVVPLREVLSNAPIDVICVDETKLELELPRSSQI